MRSYWRAFAAAHVAAFLIVYFAASAAAQLQPQFNNDPAPAPAPAPLAQPGGPPPPPPGPAFVPPPPPPPMEFDPVYVAVGGQATGPFGMADMVRKMAAGEINRETLVYSQKLGRWTPLRDVPQLVAILPNAPPVAPPPPQGGADIARLRTFMVGEWTIDEPHPVFPNATRRIQAQYTADLQVRGVETVTGYMNGIPITRTYYFQGRWQLRPLREKLFVLELTTDQGASSVQLEIVNDNTLRNTQSEALIYRTAR